MSLTASEVAALVEKELVRVSSPEAAAIIRALLVSPRCENRAWDYGERGEYVCWIVAEHSASNTCFVYCENGFGPKNPWGLLHLTSDHLSMGMDFCWYDSLEKAACDSFAWPDASST